MPLEVKFTVTTASLRFQEDTPCTFVLTNTGRDPVQVANPAMAPSLPRLKVLNIKTGVEKVYQKTRPAGGMPPIERPLGAGKSLEHDLLLLDLPGELDPGEYDVSLGCRYNKGAEFAESAPVRVKVRATTPRNLTIEGTAHRVLYGVWVNLGEDPPEIVRMRYDILKGGGARDLRPVAKASLNTRPLISTPPNGQVCPHHYVAWLDGAELKFLHLHDTQGLSPVRSVPLPGGEVRIVAPLHSDPTPENDSRPAGALLLWMGDRDKAESQLQSLKLTEAGATAQARTPLPGPKPSWLGSFTRSDGRRMALIVQASAGKVVLSLIPWPGVVGSLKKLAEWKGEFVDAGYALDGADLLRGSLLIRTGVEAHNDLDRLDFEIDPKDGFAQKPPVRITVDPQDPVDRARVAVSEQGGVAAVLKSVTGVWSIYDGKAVSPLPGLLKMTPYPPDLGFFDDTTPILLVGGKDSGFHLLTADGGPLPSDHE